LSLPRPADPAPPPWAACSWSASVSLISFDTSAVYTSKPPMGRGQLLLRLCKNVGLPNIGAPFEVTEQARDSVQIRETELSRESRARSPPNVVEAVQHYDSVSDRSDDVYDNGRYDMDVEPDSPADVALNATVPREPVYDVVLPSIVIDAMSNNELNVVGSMPIVISDDLVDTNFIGEVLEAPEGEWAGFSDLTFGLGIAAEGHI